MYSLYQKRNTAAIITTIRSYQPQVQHQIVLRHHQSTLELETYFQYLRTMKSMIAPSQDFNTILKSGPNPTPITKHTKIIDSAPWQTDSNPDPHSRLRVRDGEHIGNPDFKATCRERYVASNEDEITFPINVSLIFSGSNPDCAMAPLELNTYPTTRTLKRKELTNNFKIHDRKFCCWNILQLSTKSSKRCSLCAYNKYSFHCWRHFFKVEGGSWKLNLKCPFTTTLLFLDQFKENGMASE